MKTKSGAMRDYILLRLIAQLAAAPGLYRSRFLQPNIDRTETSRRDLQNTLLCTALKSHFIDK